MPWFSCLINSPVSLLVSYQWVCWLWSRLTFTHQSAWINFLVWKAKAEEQLQSLDNVHKLGHRVKVLWRPCGLRGNHRVDTAITSSSSSNAAIRKQGFSFFLLLCTWQIVIDTQSAANSRALHPLQWHIFAIIIWWIWTPPNLWCDMSGWYFMDEHMCFCFISY